MEARIGYVTLPADAAVELCRTLLTALPGANLHSWLEDELRVDGLCIRDDVALNELDALLAVWPKGRLFAPVVDLRWERQENDYLHLVIIGEQLPTGMAHSEALDLVDEQPSHLLLWGRGKDGVWEEGRIPGLSKHHAQPYYPKDWPGPYAAILAQTYEIDWPEGQSVRVVTRYLQYIGNYDPQFDQRFLKPE